VINNAIGGKKKKLHITPSFKAFYITVEIVLVRMFCKEITSDLSSSLSKFIAKNTKNVNSL
jgi:hypothetical protein